MLLAEVARGRPMSDEGCVIPNRTYRFGAASRPLRALLLPDVIAHLGVDTTLLDQLADALPVGPKPPFNEVSRG